MINLALSTAGNYTVINTIAASGGCAAAADTVQVTILAAPAAPSLANSGPVCAGDSVTFSVNSPLVGADYNWSNTTFGPQTGTSFSVLSGSANITYTATVTTVEGCTSVAGTTTAVVNAIPTTPVLSSNPVCAGNTLTISVTNPVSGATYSWTGPSGALATTGPTVTITNAQVAASGPYTVIRYVNGCESQPATINAVVTAAPSAPVPSSNSPVCGGGVLQLSASAVAGATYSWTGPAGFASTLQNPTRSPALSSHSGTYSVWALLNGCISPVATIQVIVSPIPAAPSLTSNSPICAGATLLLTAQGVPGAIYNWLSPTGQPFSGQTVSVPNTTVAQHSGVWTATQTINGCLSTAGATQVVINPTPAAPNVFSNSPVCQGQSLTLSTILVPGSTYTWTTPTGGTHIGQILTITNTLPSDSGQYTLVTALAGCVSPPTIVNAIVAPEPAVPAVFSNSPICEGQTLTLSTTPVAGATYNWTAPSGATYTGQTVTINGATPTTTALSGNWSLFVTSAYGCTSDTALAPIVVNPVPSQPFLSSNSPVCQGQDLQFSATPTSGSWPAGTTFSWTGPGGYFSILQHPTRTSTLPAHSGAYTLTVSANGCTSLASVINVVVNPSPVLANLSSNSPLCEGATLQLNVGTIANGTYTWTGPGGFISYVQNPTIPNITAAQAGNYSLTVTNANGCSNQTVGVVNVVVHPSVAVAATSNSPICEGGTLLLTATVSTPGVSYSWTGPNGFASSVFNPTLFNVPLAGAGTYQVFVLHNGCLSEDTVHVVVNPEPSAPVPTSNSPICAGQTLELFANGPNPGPGVAYSWTGPGITAATATMQNPVIQNATVAMQGLYQVTVFVNGCPSPLGIVQVTVQPVPQISVAPTTSTICAGESVTLTASGTGALSYSWSPTAGSQSTITVTPTVTTTYTLYSLGSNGCFDIDTAQVIVVPGVVPDAGPDQVGLCPSTTTTLAATPPTTGTGQWTILSGTGGVIASPSSPTSAFSGVINQSYQLLWTVSNPPCAPVSDTVLVSFTSGITPPAITTNNSPICVGQTLQLATALVPGATYTWTAPSGQIHVGQVLIISNATALDSGQYTLTYSTQAGCSSQPAYINYAVYSLPQTPLISSNSPLCAGQTLQLSTTAVATSYSWTGPALFNSTLQNPQIQNVTAANAGSYTLIVSNAAGCASQAATTNVVVNPAILQPSVQATSPLCVGSTLQLSANGNFPAGSTYTWSGPGFSSTLQNPSIANVQATNAGTYTVVVTTPAGCVSLPGAATVVVHPQAATPLATSNSPVCEGTTLAFTITNPVGGATYSWTGPNGFVSSLTNPTIPLVTQAAAGTYQVTVVDQNGCASATAGTVTVVVNPAPIATTQSNSPLCVGSTLQLQVTQTTGATYSWVGPNGFTSSVYNPSVFNAQQGMSGTYQVFITANGCTSEGQVQVVVQPQPTAPVPVSNPLIVCEGQPLVLSISNPVPGGLYSWTGPNSYTSTQANNTLSPSTLAMTGIYQVTVTVNGCTSAIGLVEVTVTPIPNVTVSSSAPVICTGGSAGLTAVGATNYSWTPTAGLSPIPTTGGIVTASPTVTTLYTVYGFSGTNVCPSFDTIRVQVNSALVADAGPDQTDLCGSTTTLAATPAGSVPAVWSILSGTGGSFGNDTLATSTFTGQAGQSYTLLWSLNQAPCPVSTDTVIVTFLPEVLNATAQNDTICGPDVAVLSATWRSCRRHLPVVHRYHAGTRSLRSGLCHAGAYSNHYVLCVGELWGLPERLYSRAGHRGSPADRRCRHERNHPAGRVGDADGHRRHQLQLGSEHRLKQSAERYAYGKPRCNDLVHRND